MVVDIQKTGSVEEFYRFGVDIGGTFTDCVVISETSGAMWLDKVLTTKADPSDGFMECVERFWYATSGRSASLRFFAPIFIILFTSYALYVEHHSRP